MRARILLPAALFLWIVTVYNLRGCIYERYVNGQPPTAPAAPAVVSVSKSVSRIGMDVMDGVDAVSPRDAASPPSAPSSGAAVFMAADPLPIASSSVAAVPPPKQIVVTPGNPSWGQDRLANKITAAYATQSKIVELLQKPPNADGFIDVPNGDVCSQDLGRASSVANAATECTQNPRCSGYVLAGSPPDAAWMKQGDIQLSSVTLTQGVVGQSRSWTRLYIKDSAAAKTKSTAVTQDLNTRCSFHSQAQHYNDQALFSLLGGTTTGSKEECHCASSTFGCPCIIPPALVGADHVCVELGAHHVIENSNTLWFEEQLSWTSLLVEANPVTFKQLVRNRPNAENVNGIISSQKGAFTFYSFDDTADGTQRGWANTMSGMKGSAVETKDEPTARAYAAKIDAVLGIHQVPSLTFAEIFRQKNISRIEFISVDVEGAEFNVIETIDFTQVSVRYVMFEGADQKVKDLLSKAGFVEKLGSGLGSFDTLYENPSFS